jgi:hypothetical protein
MAFSQFPMLLDDLKSHMSDNIKPDQPSHISMAQGETGFTEKSVNPCNSDISVAFRSIPKHSFGNSSKSGHQRFTVDAQGHLVDSEVTSV